MQPARRPAYRAELARWVGGQRDRDGIPDSALGPRAATGLTPVRDFTAARPDPVRYASFETTPQLAVLSTRFSAPADSLRAGQALQRVLLTAAAREVATTPLTQPLETADAWLARDPRSGVEEPQMILRLGYGAPAADPAPPGREVLDLPPENRPPATKTGRDSRGHAAARVTMRNDARASLSSPCADACMGAPQRRPGS